MREQRIAPLAGIMKHPTKRYPVTDREHNAAAWRELAVIVGLLGFLALSLWAVLR